MAAIIIGIVTVVLLILFITLYIVFSGGTEEKILKNVCIKNDKFNNEYLIQNNLNNLKLNDMSADIELVAQSVAFRAHKLLLAANSKYLETMLYTYSQGHPNVTDSNSIFQLEMSFIDHKTLSIILEFIYGKPIPKFDNVNNYSELLKASDDFQLEGLKCEVSKQLAGKLNAQNVCNLIVLAEKTDAPFLMNIASHYLLNNLNEVRSTNEWKSSTKVNGHILAQAIDFNGKLPANSTCQIECQPNTVQSMSFINNMRRYLSTEYMADATITTSRDDYSIRVNKAILIGQSVKFKQDFKNNSNIQIDTPENIDSFVLREFLMYMYSGWIVSLNKYAEGFLYLSHIYDMTALKDKCEDVIIDQLSVNNAANVVEILSRTDSQRLSNAVLDFILKNRPEVVKTDGWNNLKKNKPELLHKIFSNI